jgi:hypothetical protein
MTRFVRQMFNFPSKAADTLFQGQTLRQQASAKNRGGAVAGERGRSLASLSCGFGVNSNGFDPLIIRLQQC